MQKRNLVRLAWGLALLAACSAVLAQDRKFPSRPIDMIVYQKDGKDYLLLANSSRGVMKISTDHIEDVDGIVAPVPGGGKKGLPYETIESWKGIEQLDTLDPQHALVVRRGEGGSLNLESLDLP